MQNANAALTARLVSRPRPAHRLRPVLVARYRAALTAERAAEARFGAALSAGREDEADATLNEVVVLHRRRLAAMAGLPASVVMTVDAEVDGEPPVLG